MIEFNLSETFIKKESNCYEIKGVDETNIFKDNDGKVITVDIEGVTLSKNSVISILDYVTGELIKFKINGIVFKNGSILLYNGPVSSFPIDLGILLLPMILDKEITIDILNSDYYLGTYFKLSKLDKDPSIVVHTHEYIFDDIEYLVDLMLEYNLINSGEDKFLDGIHRALIFSNISKKDLAHIRIILTGNIAYLKEDFKNYLRNYYKGTPYEKKIYTLLKVSVEHYGRIKQQFKAFNKEVIDNTEISSFDISYTLLDD